MCLQKSYGMAQSSLQPGPAWATLVAVMGWLFGSLTIRGAWESDGLPRPCYLRRLLLMPAVARPRQPGGVHRLGLQRLGLSLDGEHGSHHVLTHHATVEVVSTGTLEVGRGKNDGVRLAATRDHGRHRVVLPGREGDS